MKTLLLSICALAAAHAQQQTPAANASVSGTVKDAGTGKPLANFNVSTYVNSTWLNDTILMSSTSKQVKAVTDEQGKYRLGDLPPGPYRIVANSAEFGGKFFTRRITMAGHDLEGIDFSVKANGVISGKVVDENKEPVPGITVHLVSREYYNGVLGYFFKVDAQTNDRGEYTLNRVEAGHPYLVMAEKRERRMPAYSEVPLDPKLRRRTPMRTFYPNSPAKEGGAPLTVQPGEHREGVDIELRKSQNYCVAGVISGPMGPASFQFGIEGISPSNGVSSGGGMVGMAPGGTTGPDGKFRICNLSPGGYRFTAFEEGPSQGMILAMGNHAMVSLAITDQDLANVHVNLNAGPRLDGEVALDGPVPVTPITARVLVSIRPLLRSPMPGENFGTRVDIPGAFSFSGLMLSDYGVSALINAPGFYIKDATWAGSSVMYLPLHMGDAMEGVGLRIVAANDGASLTAAVTDKDGNPAADMQVLVLPREISSEAMLQATLVTGVTDQTGSYHSHTLAPGKYYVVATNETFDATPESIGRLWRFRNHFQEVELTPNGSAQLTLQPVKIE